MQRIIYRYINDPRETHTDSRFPPDLYYYHYYTFELFKSKMPTPVYRTQMRSVYIHTLTLETQHRYRVGNQLLYFTRGTAAAADAKRQQRKPTKLMIIVTAAAVYTAHT